MGNQYQNFVRAQMRTRETQLRNQTIQEDERRSRNIALGEMIVTGLTQGADFRKGLVEDKFLGKTTESGEKMYEYGDSPDSTLGLIRRKLLPGQKDFKLTKAGQAEEALNAEIKAAPQKSADAFNAKYGFKRSEADLSKQLLTDPGRPELDSGLGRTAEAKKVRPNVKPPMRDPNRGTTFDGLNKSSDKLMGEVAPRTDLVDQDVLSQIANPTVRGGSPELLDMSVMGIGIRDKSTGSMGMQFQKPSPKPIVDRISKIKEAKKYSGRAFNRSSPELRTDVSKYEDNLTNMRVSKQARQAGAQVGVNSSLTKEAVAGAKRGKGVVFPHAIKNAGARLSDATIHARAGGRAIETGIGLHSGSTPKALDILNSKTTALADKTNLLADSTGGVGKFAGKAVGALNLIGAGMSAKDLVTGGVGRTQAQKDSNRLGAIYDLTATGAATFGGPIGAIVGGGMALSKFGFNALSKGGRR